MAFYNFKYTKRKSVCFYKISVVFIKKVSLSARGLSGQTERS